MKIDGPFLWHSLSGLPMLLYDMVTCFDNLPMASSVLLYLPILANYGTHKEVADGRSDIMFDSVAAFVATGRRTDLYKVEEITATINTKGQIVRTEDGGGSAEEGITFRVMTDWVSLEAANEFRYFVAKTIAAGKLVA